MELHNTSNESSAVGNAGEGVDAGREPRLEAPPPAVPSGSASNEVQSLGGAHASSDEMTFEMLI